MASNASSPLRLPDDFVWGVSTAAYQIEGAVHEGGRGLSSWDAFSHEPGRTLNGDTGDTACDHYHRFGEDVELMHELGVDAYRFSFAWPRIQPEGSGPANPRGLAFYDALVDALLTAGITPTPTLFHWDTPLALEQNGGWLNPDTAKRFADYAYLLGEHFADRVPRWITLNEPSVLSMLGYGIGMHAPGLTLGFGALTAAHTLVAGHLHAMVALRSSGAPQIGIANNHGPVWAAGDGDDDVQAAASYDALANALFADPVLTGRYPDALAAMMPEGAAEELSTLFTPLDWYGVNYYNPTLVGAPTAEAGTAVGSIDGRPVEAELPFRLVELEGYATTDFGWPIVPDGLTELLTGLRDRYGDALPPVMITENGCAINQGPDATGSVHDARRIDYTEKHLTAMADAVAAGVDVRGYFHWSLLDNFEWAAGYSQRFGLVHVDFDTFKRTRKDSYYWFRDLIAAQR